MHVCMCICPYIYLDRYIHTQKWNIKPTKKSIPRIASGEQQTRGPGQDRQWQRHSEGARCRVRRASKRLHTALNATSNSDTNRPHKYREVRIVKSSRGTEGREVMCSVYAQCVYILRVLVLCVLNLHICARTLLWLLLSMRLYLWLPECVFARRCSSTAHEGTLRHETLTVVESEVRVCWHIDPRHTFANSRAHHAQMLPLSRAAAAIRVLNVHNTNEVLCCD